MLSYQLLQGALHLYPLALLLYARVGALWSMSGIRTSLSAASFICYQKDTETNCVPVPTYSLGFILQREINDSGPS